MRASTQFATKTDNVPHGSPPKLSPTKSIRDDLVNKVIDWIRVDMKYWDLEGNKAADLLGMPRSSFHAFMNKKARRPGINTTSYLKNGLFWSAQTRQAIEDLSNYGNRVALGKRDENHIFRISLDTTLTDDPTGHLARGKAQQD